MATRSRWSDSWVKSVNRRDPGRELGAPCVCAGRLVVPAAQAAGGAVEGRSVMYLYVLGGPRLTMPGGERCFPGGEGGSVEPGVVGIVGWNGPHEPGTSRKRG